MTGPTTRLLLAAVIASGASCALLFVQVREPNQYHYWYLAWNLFLAWIPMVLAIAFGATAVQRSGRLLRVTIFGGWLLFLPNAPYLVTDVIHLRYSPVPLVQYMMFGAFALTGLLLGFGSAYAVHCALLMRYRREYVAALVYGCFVLCGVGIYLGRVVQLNSWDVVVAPGRFARAVGGHLGSLDGAADAVLFVVIAAGALAATYYVIARVAGRP